MSTFNVTDTTPVSDTPNIFLPSLKISVSESLPVTATPAVSNGTSADEPASLVTSAYKWLTTTLLAAQQQFAVHPYFTLKIVDDTIQPNSTLAFGNGTPLGQGSMCVAPDGTAFAVGLDGSNNLCVFKAADLNAVSGAWPSNVVLNTTGDNFLDSRNVYSIKCSAAYNGKYRLTVWYFANFLNDGSDLKIKLQYSDDGGTTWNKVNLTPSSFPNNNLGNISIASFTPVWNGSAMKMGCFYIKDSSDIYYIYGDTGGYVTDRKWYQNVDSGDWTLHSLAEYYLNGLHYCAFSGFRSVIDTAGVNENFSLWVTAILNLTSSSTTDLWMAPISAMPIGSASAVNQNSFMFPSASVVNGMVNLTCQAVLVESVTQTSQGQNVVVVTTHTNYILLQSDDGQGFSYPSVFVGTDGAEFNSQTYASFVLQGTYWYLGAAAGFLWQYLQENVVADVTADVIGYSISEQASQPSSISIKIANANNKWVGASTTGPGASAIARNRKIALWQGYYNASGVPEAIPRNVYFIDDIQQSVTGTTSDVTIVGRDLYKNLKTTATKFSYQFVGPTFFTDIFDGTFFSSWNQIAGTWNFIANVTPPLLELAPAVAGDNVILLAGTNGSTYGSLMRVFFRSPATTPNPEKFHFYAMYIDSSNWLRLQLDMFGGTAWKVTKCVAGSQTDLDSGTLPFTIGNFYLGVYIRRYDYFKFQFMINNAGVTSGNDLSAYDPATLTYVFKNSGNGEYDLTGIFGSPFSVALGANGTGLADFRFFFYTQFNNPFNLGTVFRKLARIAGVFAFKLTYTWKELLFTNNFSGRGITNRILTVAAGQQAISTINPMSNGEISFRAKVTVSNNSNPAGFSFIFRNSPDSSNLPDYYKFHSIQQSTGFSNPPFSSRFERFLQQQNKTYYFYNTPYDVSNNPYSGTNQPGSQNIDITQWNTYRIVMIDGWFWAFINDVMVASWNDNNTSIDYQTTGTWGFECDANSTLQVQQITAPNFWKPVPTFSYNPGDDAESAMESLIASLRAWMFSDLFGRLKAIILNATDPTTYTYDNQLFSQNVDQSDKEYVAQVTVYGSGVSATSRNTTLMAGVRTRELVIVDYTITTETDAQTRADNVLINANQFLNQNSSKQVINVGAELFDVVTVINTGNNTSGVSGDTRVYDQTIDQGGGNNNSDYFLEIDTGDV